MTTRSGRTQQRSPARRVADGTPTPCRDGCGAKVMWFRTQYGSRIALDVEPVPDDHPDARYWIDYDARVATAMSWRKQSFRPDGAGKAKYSTHFDTCPVKRSRTAAAR